jgi:hypothetical protein
MSKQMLTIKLRANEATLSKVCKRLNLSADEVDSEFGVVNIDPKRNLYTILVEEEAARRVSGMPEVEGPFSNPKIEPFGPQRKK